MFSQFVDGDEIKLQDDGLGRTIKAKYNAPLRKSRVGHWEYALLTKDEASLFSGVRWSQLAQRWASKTIKTVFQRMNKLLTDDKLIRKAIEVCTPAIGAEPRTSSLGTDV